MKLPHNSKKQEWLIKLYPVGFSFNNTGCYEEAVTLMSLPLLESSFILSVLSLLVTFFLVYSVDIPNKIGTQGSRLEWEEHEESTDGTGLELQ